MSGERVWLTWTEDSTIGAISHKLGVGGRREETSVARAAAVIVDGELALQSKGAARHQRFLCQHTSVVD